MRLKRLFLISLLAWGALHQGHAQRQGYTDDFEDGTLELRWRSNQANRPPYQLWKTVTPGTYALSEEGGVLKIAYTRKEGVGAYDAYTFRPFRAIRVSGNPRIQVQVRSDVETTLTVSPVYSMDPPTVEYLERRYRVIINGIPSPLN
jgi:hypothetical protein